MKLNVNYLNRLLKGRSGERFQLLYKFTTENISGYIKEFDLKNKSFLTVGSSGDQVINANMYGCNYVTVVDLNKNSELFFNLKRAALISLCYDEFIEFFTLDSNKKKMSIEFYRKLREALREFDLNSLILWDYIYDNYNARYISNMFHSHSGELKNVNQFNPYLKSEYNYNKTKETIRNLKVRFINGNILKSDKLFTWEKFDNIDLSNIYSYTDNLFKLKKFRNGVDELINRLNYNGKILIAYLYGTSQNNELTKFAGDDIVEDVIYSSFKGIRGIYKNTNDTDTAVIYEKKYIK